MNQKINDILQDPRLKEALPELLAGAGGAVAGGLMSGGRRLGQNESRSRYLARVLMNATLAGGAAAGGTALLRKGYKSTLGAVDKEGIMTGSKEKEQGPLASTLRGLAFSPLTAAATGGSVLAATAKGDGLLRPNNDQKQRSFELLRKALGIDKNMLRDMSGKDIQSTISGATPPAGVSTDAMHRWRSEAGLVGGKSQGSRALSWLAHKTPLSLLGTTTGSRIRRGGLGLAAAGIPAMLGALTTSDTKE